MTMLYILSPPREGGGGGGAEDGITIGHKLLSCLLTLNNGRRLENSLSLSLFITHQYGKRCDDDDDDPADGGDGAGEWAPLVPAHQGQEEGQPAGVQGGARGWQSGIAKLCVT